MMKDRVIVAMSGGVDSSIAAYLLLKQGYEVIGISMQIPYTNTTSEMGCCGIKGIDDAREVCQKLDIPFYSLNYEKEFEEKVIEYFCCEYINGKTPNPCIICNEKIKWGSLFEKSKTFGAKYFATGHYVQIEYNPLKKRYFLKKAKDTKKDQSYFLFSLSQTQLAHTKFPLANYTKEEVRELAKKIELKVHDKPGSQEICFISNKNYYKFVESRGLADNFKSGPIINEKGEVLGKHSGIAFYTIGQRKGIGAHEKPFYVIQIDSKKNTIVIGEEKELYQKIFFAKDVNLIAFDEKEFIKPIKVKAKIRYKHIEKNATIFPLENGTIRIEFDELQKSITPGQAVVFYDEDIIIGGGWII
ncbi:MAG: tRNA 2-thiouridine(34) synthase MnmA [bacterium]